MLSKVTSQIIKLQTDKQFVVRLPQILVAVRKLPLHPKTEELTVLVVSMATERAKCVLRDLADVKGNARKHFIDSNADTIREIESLVDQSINSVLTRVADAFWGQVHAIGNIFIAENILPDAMKMPAHTYELDMACQTMSKEAQSVTKKNVITEFNENARARQQIWESLERLLASKVADEIKPEGDLCISIASAIDAMLVEEVNSGSDKKPEQEPTLSFKDNVSTDCLPKAIDTCTSLFAFLKETIIAVVRLTLATECVGGMLVCISQGIKLEDWDIKPIHQFEGMLPEEQQLHKSRLFALSRIAELSSFNRGGQCYLALPAKMVAEGDISDVTQASLLQISASDCEVAWKCCQHSVVAGRVAAAFKVITAPKFVLNNASIEQVKAVLKLWRHWHQECISTSENDQGLAVKTMQLLGTKVAMEMHVKIKGTICKLVADMVKSGVDLMCGKPVLVEVQPELDKEVIDAKAMTKAIPSQSAKKTFKYWQSIKRVVK